MSTALSTQGVAATTPTSSKDRIPRHTTQEDLATAELLQNFNQQTERFDTRSQSARLQVERLNETERKSSAEQARLSKSPVSEYHSLDDAVSYPRSMERSPQSSSEQRLNSSAQAPNAPSTGQICRYVVNFLLETSYGCQRQAHFHESSLSRSEALFHDCSNLLSCPASSSTLTFTATVKQHEHRYGGVLQPERPFAMPADCTTKPEIKCDR